MSELATTKGKEFALQALKDRRASQPEKINNGDLYAGSPMYFYCIICGHLAAVLPENFIFPPKKLCDECQALKDAGWLE